jgi:arginine-tRNA-protein transferase
MDEMDFADMVEQTPVHTQIVEYREPRQGFAPGKLVGACLTDRQADGLSMIYSFYDAEHADRPGLGNFIIMDHFLRARAAGLPYVYLGYWVRGSKRMAYKARFGPVEKLAAEGWVRFEPEPVESLS